MVSNRTLKAIHDATHPAARVRKKSAAGDITWAVLRIRIEDPDTVHTLAAGTREEAAET